MRLDFLHNSDTDRLILIVAGWGSDAQTFSHISMHGWDVAVVSGFDAQLPDLSKVKDYSTVYLYAWSLGVWATCTLLTHDFKPTKAFAINGTPTPYNDTAGIPCRIFDGTVTTLNDRNLYKFRVRMCGGMTNYRQVSTLFEHITDVESLKEQLTFVRKNNVQTTSLQWDSAFIGDKDGIFPPENQEKAWEGKTKVIKLEAPHYIDLQEIIRHTIIDVERVGKRFSRSLDTYDAHSHAQRLIAGRLSEFMQPFMPASTGKAVEIGCGTGNFTREWSQRFVATEVTFIDLCDMPNFGVCGDERFLKGDAEVAMSRLASEESGRFSAIFSASTIQWFSNLPLFFKHCSKLLGADGFLAISTFAPGNLEELQSLRPDHLQYPTVEQLEEMISEFFGEVKVSEEKIELEFSTPLEVFRHLQLTGVTTSGSRRATVSELRRFADNYPMNVRGRYPLTFRPIYILAKRPGNHNEG